MKKLFFFFSLSLVLFTACKNEPANSNDGAPTTNDVPTTPNEQAQGATALSMTQTYNGLKPDIGTSYVEWTGTKANGSFHAGKIKLSDGSFDINQGSLQQGSFTIDMASIEVTDLTGSEKTDLEGHLKDPDFFDVAKFPTGKFEITGPAMLEAGNANITHNLQGKLTLKGITKDIKVPVRLELQGNNIVVSSPEFSINRTDWDIKYKSGLIGTVKDKIINDEVKLKINMVVPVPAG